MLAPATSTKRHPVSAVVEAHVDPLTARMLDALVEGLTIHRALDPAPLER